MLRKTDLKEREIYRGEIRTVHGVGHRGPNEE